MLLQPFCELNLVSCHPDSSSCVHGMQCGNGSCVWESQWCDGVTDCPAGQDEANCGKQSYPGAKVQDKTHLKILQSVHSPL